MVQTPSIEANDHEDNQKSQDNTPKGQSSEPATINRRAKIREANIHERTSIRGPAIIDRNCIISPNAYTGPYTSIGDNSTILNTENTYLDP